MQQLELLLSSTMDGGSAWSQQQRKQQMWLPGQWQQHQWLQTTSKWRLPA
jgi:hypothetical protein